MRIGGHCTSAETCLIDVSARDASAIRMIRPSHRESGMSPTTEQRPPLPPFTRETAIQKVRLAEDGWNTREPARVALAYTVDSRWRNRAEFVNGREAIVGFLTRKWIRELDYR